MQNEVLVFLTSSTLSLQALCPSDTTASKMLWPTSKKCLSRRKMSISISDLHRKVVQLKTRSLTASLACKIQSLPLSHWSFYYFTQYYRNLTCSLYHCNITLPSTNFTLRNLSTELGNNLEYLKHIYDYVLGCSYSSLFRIGLPEFLKSSRVKHLS